MGTKVDCESYSRVVLHSMRDLNEDSSASSWPHFDKLTSFLHHNNGFIQRTGYREPERDALKQKMLEHEAVFKNQVCELHRLYEIQRSMMEEAKRKKVHSFRPPAEAESSSCIPGPQMKASGLNPGTVICSREESVALNGRPFKVRRTFDLQLPSADYIDIEEEKLKDSNEPEDDTRKFMIDQSGPKTGCSRDALGSASCLRGSVELVDLNEPIQIDSSKAAPVNFLCNVIFHDLKFAGFSRSTTGSIHESKQSDTSFQSHLRNQVGSHPVLHPSGSFNCHSPTAASNTPSSFLFSSSFAIPQAPTFPSCARPTNGLSQFSSAGVINPIVEPEPVFQIQCPFTTKLFANSSSRPSNGFHHGAASSSRESWFNLHSARFFDTRCSSSCRLNILNTSCHQDGKSSAVTIDINKEVPRSPSDEVVILEDLDSSVTKIEKPCLRSKQPDANEASPSKLHCRNEADGVLKHADTPPANDSNIAMENEFSDAKSVKKIVGFSRQRDKYELLSPVSSGDDDSKPDCKKSPGFRRRSQMIDINVAFEPDKEIPEKDTTSEKKREITGASFGYCIDLNAACASDSDDQPVPCVERTSVCAKKMLEIDLEAAYLPEDNMESKQCEQIDSDLLSLPAPEQDEGLRDAAELVVAMSSSCPKMVMTEDKCRLPESLLAECLHVLANAIAASEKGIGNKRSSSDLSKDMDEFEATTLQLEEAIEEEYLPKAIALELQNLEERGGVASNNRPRRIQTRRKRQRKDFQRDILPGLSSLSRHEVTEDLQIFGGLMRIMGHCRSPGLARRNGGRNGGGRGKKRAVVQIAPPAQPVNPVSTPLIQQLNSIEAGSEDKSLTGWGEEYQATEKTTVPTRQSCFSCIILM